MAHRPTRQVMPNNQGRTPVVVDMPHFAGCGRVIVDGWVLTHRELPPTESSLSQEGNFRDFWARRVHVPSKAQLPKVLAGPGVTSPKSRPPGCRAGHAGHESFPLVLPGPYLLVSTRSWRYTALATCRL